MRLSEIDLRLLRVFVAVAEAGGFAKAQGALGISQPAISTQIAKLEDRLGVRLCDRGPQGFSMTAAGTAVLDEAVMLLAQIDAAAARLNAIGKAEPRQVRIGVVDCMVTDPNNPLVPVLKAVRQSDSDIKIQIGVNDFPGCLEELRAMRLDIAIVGIAANERIPSETEALRLYVETSSLFCSPDHPCAGITDANALWEALERSEISAHSFVYNPMDQALAPKLLDQSEDIAQDTMELTAYLALSGSHVGLLPDHYAAHWVQSGALVALAPHTSAIVSEFHALRLEGAVADPSVNQVWAFLKARSISS